MTNIPVPPELLELLEDGYSCDLETSGNRSTKNTASSPKRDKN